MGFQNITLVKIAAVGGFATVTMGLALKFKIISNVKNTEFYKDALKTLRSHRGAVHLLGEPIKDGTIDVEKTDLNFVGPLEARYEVPVKGPKQEGRLYLHAQRKSENDNWVLYSLHLGLKNEPNKRLIIVKTE